MKNHVKNLTNLKKFIILERNEQQPIFLYSLLQLHFEKQKEVYANGREGSITNKRRL